MLQLSPAACEVQAATAADWPAIVRLLTAAGLPVADLQPADVAHFVVARRAAAVVGAVAVEAHGADGSEGLLRSLVVDPAVRGTGIGARLLAAAEDRAHERGLRSLTLLTQSAAPFFAAHGYSAIERGRAPASLHATPQFAALCPASSTCMTKPLVPTAT